MMDKNLNDLLKKMEKQKKRFESLDKMRKIAKAADIIHGLYEPMGELGLQNLNELAEDGKIEEGLEIIDKFNELVDDAFEELLYVLFN